MAKIHIFLVHSVIMHLISMANGFSMQMIPIHSLLPQHFSAQERDEFLVNISLSRAHNFYAYNSLLSPNSIVSPFYGPHNRVAYYITPLYISEGYSTFAILDTGDFTTWIQCEGCNDCFEFDGQKFDYKKSPNYVTLSVSDPLCPDPNYKYMGTCGLQKNYISGQKIEGFFGKDDFHFTNPDTHNLDIYKGIVFGCAMKTKGVKLGGPHSLIAGIFGLGADKISFIKQLDSQIKGRFSYCIPTFTTDKEDKSTLYFGDAAQISGDDTRQLKVISMNSGHGYHLNMNGISVDGIRLPIDISVFKNNQTSGEGFVIDLGAPYSVLDKRAYNVLVYYVAKYFGDKFGWQPVPLEDSKQKLCYADVYPRYESMFPSIIYHFQGKEQGEEVDMIMEHKNMFKRTKRSNGFCMMINFSPTPGISLLGAFQQANFQFLFDVNVNLLYFVPHNCQHN